MYALVINMIAGQLDRLETLIEEVRDMKLGAVLLLGNVIAPQQSGVSSAETPAEETYHAAIERLGSLGAPIYLIPGAHDPSLATINRLVKTYGGPAHIHLVHRTTAVLGTTDVVAGFGGKLTQEQPTTDESIHFPAWEARVAFEHLHAYNDVFRSAPRRIFLFAVPPQSTHTDRQASEDQGVGLLTSLIRAYQPALVCCGGPAGTRGVEMIDGTQVVNPGWLADGAYALIDLQNLTVHFKRLVTPITVQSSFRSIVVALDGSAESWRAFELAAGLATRTGAKLTLVYAWEPISAARGQPFFDNAVAQRIESGERLLATASRYVPDLAIEHEVLEGPAAAAIVRVAEAHHADLLVMGARGIGPLRSALGSVSQRVIHDTACPVLIAREPPQNAALLELSAASQERLPG
ncbi:MAG TPA: universal stress protein [Herpetosiphonaceae bacterium]